MVYAHYVQEDVDQGVRRMPGNGEHQEKGEVDSAVARLAEALAGLSAEQRRELVTTLNGGN
jgi:hypothetical protein